MIEDKLYRLGETIIVGYAGEKDARHIRLDVSQLIAQWPQARPSLMILRRGDKDPYPADTETDDSGILTWHVHAEDADEKHQGYGEYQVFMTAGEEILGKSTKARINVIESLPGTIGTTPAAAQSWVQSVLAASDRVFGESDRAVEASEAAQAAQEAAEKAQANARESEERARTYSNSASGATSAAQKAAVNAQNAEDAAKAAASTAAASAAESAEHALKAGEHAQTAEEYAQAASDQAEAAAASAEEAAQAAQASQKSAENVKNLLVVTCEKRDDGRYYANKTSDEIEEAAKAGTVVTLSVEGNSFMYTGETMTSPSGQYTGAAFFRIKDSGTIYAGIGIGYAIVNADDGVAYAFNYDSVRAVNPRKLTITGAVSAEYDGSASVTINIPEGSAGAGGIAGADGEDGGYYRPTVAADGTLSWTASKADMPSVASANIKGAKGDKGDKGDPGATGAAGAKGDKGDKGDPGQNGAPGADGYSPTVNLTRISDGVRIDVTDKNGTRSEIVYDGEDGAGGSGEGGNVESVPDEDVLNALIDADLLAAVYDDTGILTDESGAILTW